jgi:hypothetical protein
VFDDLATYYHEQVVSTFLAYRDISNDGVSGRNRDLRRALEAATALFHLREHLPSGGKLSRADVEQLCPDYALLGDVVNVAKHRELNGQTPHGAPLITSAENLDEELTIIEYTDEIGPYRYVQKSVIVKLDNGSERDLLEVLTNVINFWEAHLATLGAVSAARTFKHNHDIHPRTRAECEAIRTDFECVQGLRFQQRMRLLRFDNSTGKATPIDLTGAQFSARIYRPKFEVDLTLARKADGKEFKTTITLSEDESAEVARMKDSAEVQAFVAALPAAHVALQKLAAEAGSPLVSTEPQTGGKGDGDA